MHSSNNNNHCASTDAVTKVKVCRDPQGDDCGITDDDIFDVGDLLYAIAEDGRDDVSPTVTWICNEDRKLENSSGSSSLAPAIPVIGELHFRHLLHEKKKTKTKNLHEPPKIL